MRTTSTEPGELAERETRSAADRPTESQSQVCLFCLLHANFYALGFWSALQGYAYTFITEEQARYAGDIIKALELSGSPVPPELEQLWASFKDQQKAVSVENWVCFKIELHLKFGNSKSIFAIFIVWIIVWKLTVFFGLYSEGG